MEALINLPDEVQEEGITYFFPSLSSFASHHRRPANLLHHHHEQHLTKSGFPCLQHIRRRRQREEKVQWRKKVEAAAEGSMRNEKNREMSCHNSLILPSFLPLIIGGIS